MNKYLRSCVSVIAILVLGISSIFSTFAGNTAVTMSILAGIVSIGAPTTLAFTSTISVSLGAQTLTQAFTGGSNYFYVLDMKGIDSGYTTTLQMLSGSTALSTTGGAAIAASNIAFQADNASGVYVVMSGAANPNVVINSLVSGYQTLDVARTWIYRNVGVNTGVIGQYGQAIDLRISVPASQPAGNYAGTLIYTVVEN